MIDAILLVDDEDLFHLVFEDACSLLEISLSLDAVYSADEAEELAQGWFLDPSLKPDCVFVDLNIIGSSFNGIELIRRVNQNYGNDVVIGIISSSADPIEREQAKAVGAMFWIVKSDEIEPRLEKFHADFEGFKNGTISYREYL